MIVHYSSKHSPDQEWVYNGADIDDSKVVWAREMDPKSDAQLTGYFKDREVWLLNADSKPARVVPYDADSNLCRPECCGRNDYAARSRRFRQHEIGMQPAPRRIDLLAIRRDARRFAREIANQRIFYREDGVAIQILIAIHKQMRHQRLVPIGHDHEMHVRGPVGMPRGRLEHLAHRAIVGDRIELRHDGPKAEAALRIAMEARPQRRLFQFRQLHVVETLLRRNATHQ